MSFYVDGAIGGRFLNNSVFPNQLYTAISSENNGVMCAIVTVPTFDQDVYINRIILQTTLQPSDMIGGLNGEYWNLNKTPPVQAPFYLFAGSMSPSNMIDISLIGSVNVGEYLRSVRIPQNTNVFGVWRGVKPESVGKCQLTLSVDNRP